MFEFRLGCRFAWLCLSILPLSSLSFSLLLQRNLTFDLARESLVPRTILSPYKSFVAGRRTKEGEMSRIFPRICVLHYRLTSFSR